MLDLSHVFDAVAWPVCLSNIHLVSDRPANRFLRCDRCRIRALRRATDTVPHYISFPNAALQVSRFIVHWSVRLLLSFGARTADDTNVDRAEAYGWNI